MVKLPNTATISMKLAHKMIRYGLDGAHSLAGITLGQAHIIGDLALEAVIETIRDENGGTLDDA